MEELTFDLIARRCMEVPRVWYSDRSEVWRITCVGRPLRPAVRWRASIATSRKMEDNDIIVRLDKGISVGENVALVTLDVFFLTFRNAVRSASTGRDLWFALYGIDAAGIEAEYIEIKFKGFPSVDPPGMNPKDLPSLREYYSAEEVNALFCYYAGASLPATGPYDGEWLICTTPQVASYYLTLPVDEPPANIKLSANPEFIPACGYFWLHIDKGGTGPLTFSPGIRWFEGDGGYTFDWRTYSDSPEIDFGPPGMYRLLFEWDSGDDNVPAHWYNLSGKNKIASDQE